jgi:hypothetical protein
MGLLAGDGLDRVDATILCGFLKYALITRLATKCTQGPWPTRGSDIYPDGLIPVTLTEGQS